MKSFDFLEVLSESRRRRRWEDERLKAEKEKREERERERQERRVERAAILPSDFTYILVTFTS